MAVADDGESPSRAERGARCGMVTEEKYALWRSGWGQNLRAIGGSLHLPAKRPDLRGGGNRFSGSCGELPPLLWRRSYSCGGQAEPAQG